MKFVSKNSNLMVVLTPGLPSQPVLGIPAKSGESVRFKDGIAVINEEALIEKLHNHPGFGSDFIAVGEDGKDPFAYQREETEPTHVIQEITYGHATGSKSSPNKRVKIPADIQKMVNDLAMEKVKELLPILVENTINKIEQAKKEKSDTDSSK